MGHLITLQQVTNILLTCAKVLDSFFIFALGSIIGSFVNVIVGRFPKRQDLVFTPSNCPRCHRAIPWWFNVPVLGWFFTKKRCKQCEVQISWQYPLVEFGFGLLFWGILQNGQEIFRLALLLVFSIWIVLALVDAETERLYDILVFPLIWFSLLFSFVFPEHYGSRYSSVLGAVLCMGIAWMIARLGRLLWGRQAFGDGDIKLAAALGAILGPLLGVLVFPLAFVFGGAWGAWKIAIKEIRRKDPVPFGPALVAAAMLLALSVSGNSWAKKVVDMVCPWLSE
jgi:leader peptidase (prepilin peptidase)/N-methyltransferase